MRKVISLALVTVLALTVFALLPGCGGDTKQAQEYMEQGDKLTKQFQTEASKWQQSVSNVNASDPAVYKASLEEAKTSAANLSKTVEEAKAEYKKILSLDGVDDYAEYAELEIEALDKTQEFIKLTTDFFDQAITMIDSGDFTSQAALMDEYTDRVNTLGKEITELDEEAQELKSDKDL